MLALTEDACQAIEGILGQTPEGAGLRIAPDADANGAGRLQLSVVGSPSEGDQVIDSDGGRVFVEASTTPLLDDKVLDATVTEEAVRFEILARA
jgi:iron-sulfur cluster assembly protein